LLVLAVVPSGLWQVMFGSWKVKNMAQMADVATNRLVTKMCEKNLSRDIFQAVEREKPYIRTGRSIQGTTFMDYSQNCESLLVTRMTFRSYKQNLALTGICALYLPAGVLSSSCL
jgi:hypothetical protein